MNVLIDGVWTNIDNVSAEELIKNLIPDYTEEDNKFLKVTAGVLSWGSIGSGGYDGDPTVIAQDATHRFVSDVEKADWDSKADELGADDNYVTDAEKVKLSNLSGTNSGDQNLAPYFNKSVDDSDDLTEGATKLLLTSGERTKLSNTSNTNTGDQTTIVGISGTLAQFNTACSNADFASGGGTASGTNTGDQTSIVGISGTLAQFNTACSDADFASGGGTATGTNTGDNATNSQYSGLAASKQDTLVSATNIKSVNGSSLLGSGNLVVNGTAPELPMVKMVSTANQTITAGYASIIPYRYTIGNSFITAIGDGGVLQIS